jgi:hypothetical protein
MSLLVTVAYLYAFSTQRRVGPCVLQGFFLDRIGLVWEVLHLYNIELRDLKTL